MRARPHALPLLLGGLAVLLAALAVLFARTDDGVAGPSATAATTTPRARQVLRLGRDKRFPVAAIPTVEQATVALRIGRLRLQDARIGCPGGTVDLGTWCLDRDVRGRGTFAEASRACARAGGRLPTAAQLIGAAPTVRLSGRSDDRPFKALTSAERDLRELSSTLITVSTGSAASGSFKAPAPATLQPVTVYDNGDAGGFAGSVPSGSAERFRCATLERQPGPQRAAKRRGL